MVIYGDELPEVLAALGAVLCCLICCMYAWYEYRAAWQGSLGPAAASDVSEER